MSQFEVTTKYKNETSKFVAKNGSNPSQKRFSDHEMEIIEQATITLAIALDNLIQGFENPEQIMKEYYDMNSSQANVTRVFTALQLGNIDQEKGAYPAQIKNAIIEMSTGSYKRSEEDFLANSSNLPKVLKEFEGAGITFSIIGKKEIKKKSPKSIPRKPKAGEYKKGRFVGPPVVKKLTTTIEDYKKILSNSQALALINNKLIKYGKLEKAYDLICKAAFYFFREGNEKAYDFLEAFKVLFPNLDPSVLPDLRLFQQAFNSADEKTLEKLRNELVQHLLETPSSCVFFAFSLTKLV